jgi:DNA-directed RNA polymerase sigma subunit (sigma70/sigma32)
VVYSELEYDLTLEAIKTTFGVTDEDIRHAESG